MIVYLAAPHTYPGMIAEMIVGGNGKVFIEQGDQAAMRLFMAGAIQGNLSTFWKRTVRYMDAGKDFSEATEEAMQLYLAGAWPWRNEGMYDQTVREARPYILESFFYCDKDTERLLPYFGDFLLDSGAFTFMQGKGGSPDWDEYVERYADFINRNNIQKFFELDIDTVTGYKRVQELRCKLEKLVNRPCIPVWHKIRGIHEYKRHCEEYDYVAIGGYVTKELKPADYASFPAMIRYAHTHSAKVHCLGFTKLSDLPRYHFDSVDSTAWTTGNRFGYVYYFDGRTMKKKDAPQGSRLADPRKVALHNYTEWVKFQKWAITHL